MNDITIPTTTSEISISGITRRLMALLYDSLLLLGISFGYGVIVLLIRMAFGADTLSAPTGLTSVIILSGLWGSYALFYVWCWRKSGQTLGMKSWRIKLCAGNGELPNIRQCWQRCIIAPPLLLLGGLGYLWCLLDSNGDSLQDKLTGTRVSLLPKTKR